MKREMNSKGVILNIYPFWGGSACLGYRRGERKQSREGRVMVDGCEYGH